MTGELLRLESVAMTYAGPPPVHALQACSLEVRSGDFVTIAGASGSGKSTLLNILGLLNRPTHGNYYFQGVDCGTLSEGARSALRGQRIGFVFQTFELLSHRPAVDSVMLSLIYRNIPRKQHRQIALDALDRVGLTHRTHAVAGTMSGGERQRVAIARALAASPSLLLCDEPTGNLDTSNAAVVLDLLRTVNADGVTVAMITHNPEVAAMGSRRLSISDGVTAETA